MSRTDTAALLAALLCVAALGLAAATVAAPLDSEQFARTFEDPAATEGSPFDVDIDNTVDYSDGPDASGETWTFTTQCVPFLLTPLFYGLTLVGFAGLFAGVRRKLATEYGFAAVAFVVPILVFVHATFTESCTREPQGIDWGLPSGSVVNETMTQASQPVNPETSTPILGIAVAGAFLLLVVAALATTVRQRSSGREAAPTAPEPSPDHDLSGVAKVAGEAADRIEGGEADPENAVFRAWKDMTAHLDLPNAQTASPAEFRAAARDAGMSRDHVADLTDVFREVRYGGADPTPDREERAVEALRVIEDTYGGEA